MKITVSSASSMTRVFEGAEFPEELEEIHLECDAWQYVNLFLNSRLDARVTATFPDKPLNLAGMFSCCRQLSRQPVLDTQRAVSLAALFKSCESMRFSTHFIDTRNCQDFRQMFWGAINFSGNGPQAWDFSSARSPDGLRNFFGGGSGIQTRYYNELLRSLHRQMKAGTLPTPMSPVDFGESKYTEYARAEREELIAYGWDIRDAGQQTVGLSPLEKELAASVRDAVSRGDQWLDAVDCSPIAKSARNGTLITRRHIVGVKHYTHSVGQTIQFWNGQRAKVAAADRCPEADLCIATLDREVDIRPALVLPKDYERLLPNVVGPPCKYPTGDEPYVLFFSDGNSDKPPGIAGISFVSTSQPTGWSRVPYDEELRKHGISIRIGDSGSGVCFVRHGGRMILAYPLATSGGTGPWVASHRDWIDSVVRQEGCSVEEVSG